MSENDDEMGGEETSPGSLKTMTQELRSARQSQRRMRVADTVLAWVKQGEPRSRSVTFTTDGDGELVAVAHDSMTGSSARIRLDLGPDGDPFTAAMRAVSRAGM